ncbi:MAG: hypothetical protein IJZ87_02910 [Bacteroidales bacterium]|nr:hypothetical protein [Bacteroidales bacterium]
MNSIEDTFNVSVQVPELVEGTTTSPGASTGSATESIPNSSLLIPNSSTICASTDSATVDDVRCLLSVD